MVKRNVKGSIAQMLEMPEDIALDMPRLVLLGNMSLHAENHKGIIEYTPNRIIFASTAGEVEVIGSSLMLTALKDGEIGIEGEIYSVSYRQS